MKALPTELFTMQDAANEIGINYYKLYRAILDGTVTPLQAGRVRLLTIANVKELQKHFADKKARKEGK